MTNCDNYIELIALSIDDGLNSFQKAQLDEHMTTCDECKAIYQDFCKIAQNSVQEDIIPPVDLHDKIMEHVSAERVSHVVQYSPKLSRKTISTLAAGIAIVLITSAGLGSLLGRQSNEANTLSDVSPEVGGDLDNGTFALAQDRAVQVGGVDLITDSPDVLATESDLGDTGLLENAEQKESIIDSLGYEDERIALPPSLSEEAFAFVILAKVGEIQPNIEGEILYTDTEKNYSYIAIPNNLELLEKTLIEFESVGAKLSLATPVDHFIDASAENVIIIIEN